MITFDPDNHTITLLLHKKMILEDPVYQEYNYKESIVLISDDKDAFCFSSISSTVGQAIKEL